uniref:Mitochondrial mRNA-processing protein COX24 C-terminal domain-containing protein n=1 Tax=Peronospora matthiolae TaxID=2874970 RepID=A0AAV1V1L1_9STRA
MRLHYVALLVATALATSAHGRQTAPDAGNPSPVQKSLKVLNQVNAADKTPRFLVSKDRDVPLTVASPRHLSAAVQAGGADRQLRSHDYEEEPSDDENRMFKKLRKKIKKARQDRRELRKMRKRHRKELISLARKQRKRHKRR